jgi:hypothetical protein
LTQASQAISASRFEVSIQMISPVKGKNLSVTTAVALMGSGVSIQMISPVKGKELGGDIEVDIIGLCVSIQMISPVKGKLPAHFLTTCSLQLRFHSNDFPC